MTNTEVVCVDGVDTVEAVVVRYANSPPARREHVRVPVVQRFKEPVPPQGPFEPRFRVHLASLTREWPEKWTPAHASKAVCANQLPVSLSAKRTVAFGSALRTRGPSPFRADSESWQGQFRGQLEAEQRSRNSKPKKGRNTEWRHPHDPDARITKMKDRRTHLAHKAEHAVDPETGAVVGVTVQGRRSGGHDDDR
jgi:hypothetical protein